MKDKVVVAVGHRFHGLAHYDYEYLVFPEGNTWGSLCGIEFEPEPATTGRAAEGKPMCTPCVEIADRNGYAPSQEEEHS
jgi:hypothetical protein